MNQILLSRSPHMMRNQPILFTLCCLTVPVAGLGAVALLLWWYQARCLRLELTPQGVRLRRGVLARAIDEIAYSDVRNIRVTQTFGQRLFSVGTLEVSSAGQADVEIRIDGIYAPNQVADMIREKRRR